MRLVVFDWFLYQCTAILADVQRRDTEKIQGALLARPTNNNGVCICAPGHTPAVSQTLAPELCHLYS